MTDLSSIQASYGRELANEGTAHYGNDCYLRYVSMESIIKNKHFTIGQHASPKTFSERSLTNIQ